MPFPALYPIVDFSCFAAQADPILAIVQYVEELISAGATLIQLRDKSQPDQPRRFLSCARELRRATWGTGTKPRATLIINDRLDICLAADADGIHLGQDDLSPESARRVFDSVSHPLRSMEAQRDQRQSGSQRMGHPGESSGRENVGDSGRSGPEEKGDRGGLAIEEREPTRKLLIGFSTHNVAQVIAADSLPIDYIAIGPVFATGSKANPDPVVGLEGVRQARRVTKKPLVAIGGITRQNCAQVKAAGADAVALISDLLESPAKAVADFLRVLG
jgi:thiamine monophosphate synthase